MACQSNIVSFHRPAQHLFGLDRKSGDGEHLYQPKYFEYRGACADCQRHWRFRHPLEHDVAKRRVAPQLQTHPLRSHENRAQPRAARLSDVAGANRKPCAEAMASENAQS